MQLSHSLHSFLAAGAAVAIASVWIVHVQNFYLPNCLAVHFDRNEATALLPDWFRVKYLHLLFV